MCYTNKKKLWFHIK